MWASLSVAWAVIPEVLPHLLYVEDEFAAAGKSMAGTCAKMDRAHGFIFAALRQAFALPRTRRRV
jgi:hypothetical protein